jgi:hypothetical protein
MAPGSWQAPDGNWYPPPPAPPAGGQTHDRVRVSESEPKHSGGVSSGWSCAAAVVAMFTLMTAIGIGQFVGFQVDVSRHVPSFTWPLIGLGLLYAALLAIEATTSALGLARVRRGGYGSSVCLVPSLTAVVGAVGAILLLLSPKGGWCIDSTLGFEAGVLETSCPASIKDYINNNAGQPAQVLAATLLIASIAFLAFAVYLCHRAHRNASAPPRLGSVRPDGSG